jgi:hypothetical protein
MIVTTAPDPISPRPAVDRLGSLGVFWFRTWMQKFASSSEISDRGQQFVPTAAMSGCRFLRLARGCGSIAAVYSAGLRRHGENTTW